MPFDAQSSDKASEQWNFSWDNQFKDSSPLTKNVTVNENPELPKPEIKNVSPTPSSVKESVMSSPGDFIDKIFATAPQPRVIPTQVPTDEKQLNNASDENQNEQSNSAQNNSKEFHV